MLIRSLFVALALLTPNWALAADHDADPPAADSGSTTQAARVSAYDATYEAYLDRRYSENTSRTDEVQAGAVAAVLVTAATPVLFGTALFVDLLAVNGAKDDAKDAYADYHSAAQAGSQDAIDEAWKRFEDERSAANTMSTLSVVLYTAAGATALLSVVLWVVRPTRPDAESFTANLRPLHDASKRGLAWTGVEATVGGAF
jgi:hypothetical protein